MKISDFNNIENDIIIKFQFGVFLFCLFRNDNLTMDHTGEF